MSTRYIYTEKNDCQDCYKCIRECPVKAIKVEGQSASVLQEQCIYCGYCTQVCPVEAKKVKEDISKVKFFLQQRKSVFVSLAPSFQAEFPSIKSSQLVAALKKLGFAGVSETAIGAEIMSEYSQQILEDLSGSVYISPCCPATVDLIKKYYPEHADKILPVDTPMLTHGKFLRQQYGEHIKTVFIGPCIAKKKEAEFNTGTIDAVITFKRLKQWFQEENIILEEEEATIEESAFVPFPAQNGKLFPIEGGMIECMTKPLHEQGLSFLSFSGTKRLLPILSDLDKIKSDQKVFLELMTCEGGCINGPGNVNPDSLVVKHLKLQKQTHKLPTHQKTSLREKLVNGYTYIEPLKRHAFSESEIKETLLSVGKHYHKDELNCGGCGYESCRDLAKAILSEQAERMMCVSYMRRVAQDKASVLLQRMPYGVVIVDKNLHVIESNRNFASLIDEKTVALFDKKQGLEGEDLRELLPYAHYFENMLDAGVISLEKDIKAKGKLLHLSIFSLHGNHLLCAILRNLSAPEMKKEEIVKRSRTVIRENLKTVQKIAFYLGENASNMETLLNSIVDIQNDDNNDVEET